MEGFTFEPICDVHTEEIKKNSVATKVMLSEIVVHPSGCVLPRVFEKDFKQIYNFEVFPDDIWIVTHPKSGTTWAQEMIWLLRNKFDYATAKSVPITYRFPFLELNCMINDEIGVNVLPNALQMIAGMPRPRFIKTHLPLELLPKALWKVKPKIIYVTRDPRDVAISYYHHYRLWIGYRGTLENFTNAFLADRLVYSPFWSHVLGFWNLKDKSHVFIISYEEMKKDLSSVIRKMADFLEVKILDKELEELKEHLTFKNMKKNASVNYSDLTNYAKKVTKYVDDNLVFMRNGESGGWVNVYSQEMIEKFRKWTAEKLANTPFQEYPHSSS